MPSFRLNNVRYSWQSCSLKVDGTPIFDEGVQSMDYEVKRERKTVWGARKDGGPIGRTAGKVTYGPVKLVTTREAADVFTSYLALKGLGSYGDAEFIITLQVSEPLVIGSGPSIPIIVVISGCNTDSVKAANGGDDESTTEFEIGCMNITENGKDIASLVRSIL